MRNLFQEANRERGQMLVLVAFIMVAMLAFTGLIIDGGNYFSERRQAQNAADEAALAAAYEMSYGGSNAEATAAAFENAAANGFNNDGVSNTVTVNIPPTSGEFVGMPRFAEVIVEEDPGTYFIQLVLSPDGVRARGVAGVIGEGDGQPGEGGDPVDTLVLVPNVDCGSPTVDGRVTEGDGYTKIGELVGGSTDYGDAYYACDDTYHYFALRLNALASGGVANENVYGCKLDPPDCPSDYNQDYNTGWGKHDFGALWKSDRARFQTSCDGAEVHDFVQDYLRQDGSSWASDTAGDGSVIVAGPDQSASSLEWNLEHPVETGWGDDPGEEPFVLAPNGKPEKKLGQSPPFNPEYPNFDPEYAGWEWEMIYEFRVPKASYDSCTGPTYFGVVPFEGQSGPSGGIHSSPAKEDGAGSVFLTPLDIRLVE